MVSFTPRSVRSNAGALIYHSQLPCALAYILRYSVTCALPHFGSPLTLPYLTLRLTRRITLLPTHASPCFLPTPHPASYPRCTLLPTHALPYFLPTPYPTPYPPHLILLSPYVLPDFNFLSLTLLLTLLRSVLRTPCLSLNVSVLSSLAPCPTLGGYVVST